MTKRIISSLLSITVLLSLLAVFTPARVYAAATNGIDFACKYSAQTKKLTVTASVVNPDAAVSTAMFVLAYDKNKLTASEDSISFCEGAKESAKYYDADKGYIGADWYYLEQRQKSTTKTPSVTIVFDAKSAASADALKDALTVCTDTDYLNSIGGYGVDGGVLLCTDSTHTYSSAKKTAEASFSYTDAAKPGIIFDCAYNGTAKTLTVTASIDNQDTTVGAAMFVLDYDTAKLSVKASDISFLNNAVKSKTYLETASGGSSVPTKSAGRVGADWYYNTALPESSTPTKAVQTVFTVKDGVSLDDIEDNALDVCDNETYLKSLTYDNDGGVLICRDGTTFYNAKDATAYSKFNYTDATKTVSKPGIIFDCAYNGTAKTLTVTASIDNPDTTVGAAMFVLDYDTAKLSVKASDISFLNNAVKSKTYLETASGGSSVPTASAGRVGADWYYNTALPASSTPTKAVQTVFTVKDGVSLDDIEDNALDVCDNEAYLKSLTYDNDGGVLICRDGTTFYNAKDATAYSKFNYTDATPSSEGNEHKVTVTNGTASVDGKTVTSAKAGDTVTITANSPASGKKFSGWQIDSGNPQLASKEATTTSFKMPANDVALTALYTDTTSNNSKYYSITANNGYATVDGQTVTSALPGQTVVLHYNTPSTGTVFNGWRDVSDNVSFKNVKGNTGFVMPAADVVVEATYTTNSNNTVTGDNKNYTAPVVILLCASAVALAVELALYRRKHRRRYNKS